MSTAGTDDIMARIGRITDPEQRRDVAAAVADVVGDLLTEPTHTRAVRGEILVRALRAGAAEADAASLARAAKVELYRALAIRWGWDPDHLSDEQNDQIADQIRIWAQ